jgi:glucose/arabinose dehydrogenase
MFDGTQQRPPTSSRILLLATCAATVIGAALIGLPIRAVAASGTATSGTAAVPAKGYELTVLRKSGLGVPRGLVELKDGSLLIADMGGWTKNVGRVLLVARSGSAAPKVLFTKLDRPHGITIGPDGFVYVGEVGKIFRFDPATAKPTKQYVVGDNSGTAALPIRTPHLHPLTQLFFLQDGSMVVNVGSDSNNCAEGKKSGVCSAAAGPKAVGVVRRYVFDKPGGRVTSSSVYASGLRNSMGFAQHTSGTVLQIENSRDAIDEADPKLSDDALPHDELNELVPAANYGWPYCFDNQRNSPEFKKYACKSSKKPLTLLPAHCAPLGMTYWNNKLVITYHGYRDTGHRMVSFPIDSAGRPTGPSAEILGGWAETDDFAPGGPVGVIGAADGSLLVVDDRNGTLLQVTAQ